ncbi:MAG: LEA type 2 family protein [Flavobacteriales bacterium]
MRSSVYLWNLKLLSFLVALTFIVSSCKFEDVEIIRVEDVKISSFTKSGFAGEITVLIKNPNGFPVTISTADFKVLHKNNEIGVAQLEESFKINSNSTEPYPIKVKGDLGGLFAGGVLGIVGMLTGGDPKVVLKGAVKGKAFLVSKTFPIELETNLPISGLGR